MTLFGTQKLSLVCLLALSLVFAGCAGFNQRQRLPQTTAMDMAFEVEPSPAGA
jgi:hypothetical protein